MQYMRHTTHAGDTLLLPFLPGWDSAQRHTMPVAISYARQSTSWHEQSDPSKNVHNTTHQQVETSTVLGDICGHGLPRWQHI